jgi:hypothetical protein
MYSKGSPVEIQTPTHWNLIGRRRPPRHLCYRPAVFFSHLRLSTLSFPQGEIRHAVQKYYYFIFFFLLFKTCGIWIYVSRRVSVCLYNRCSLFYSAHVTVWPFSSTAITCFLHPASVTPLFISPNDMFINRYHYCGFLVWQFIDFARPRSHIAINPIQYQIHPTRTQRTRPFRGTYTHRWTRVSSIRKVPVSKIQQFWLKFFRGFTLLLHTNNMIISQFKSQPPPSIFLPIYHSVIILPFDAKQRRMAT